MLEDFISKYPHSDMANIGGDGDEGRIENKFDNYDMAVNKFDICTSALPKKYQTIISLNTFEHLYDPIRAAENIVNSLKVGGYVFMTCPFMYHHHDYENVPDYFRYTPTGVRLLFKKLQEDSVECIQDITDAQFGGDGKSNSAQNIIVYIGHKK